MAVRYFPMRNTKSTQNEEVPAFHWADKAAEDLIALHPDKTRFVCASGISPSGVVHIGNFREVITVDFVVRSLRDRGKEVHFIYSWDDYDAFRKVPANLPDTELTASLRKPLSKVPDPFGDCTSYARHFEKLFESEIAELGIFPAYIYQSVAYEKCAYFEGIRHAYESQARIAAILNESRTEVLADNWSCISIFCKECSRDTTKLLAFEPPDVFNYECTSCKKKFSIQFDREPGAKLLWRVDWPMRWAKEGVDFEPGGKDHSSQGGSYETGAKIIREIWKKEPPFYVQYDFVLAKGRGAKLSSSKGELITLSEALAIYEPAVIRWIFASRKPNIDFSIAFDLDVMKAYDDFDRCERYYYGVDSGEEKKVNYEKRIYELAMVDKTAIAKTQPAQFAFRHLCNILQVHLGDIEKAKAYFTSSIKNSLDEKRFYQRSVRAWKWVTTYAPDEFRFQLCESLTKSAYPKAVAELVGILEKGETDEQTLSSAIYQIMKQYSIEPKIFFQEVYRLLIGKPSGPKLSSFLLAIGRERAAQMLRKTV